MSVITRLAAVLFTVALSSSSVVNPPSNNGQQNFELLILHNNDMHARFEQTSQLSGACTLADREAGKCYGGFPRVATVVKEARKKAASGEGPPVLYLNAGDTYTGTAWFTIYKWKVAAEFINALQPDAVSLGNHEFDERVSGVVPFIRNVSTPVLAANLILDQVPELENETNLRKSIVLKIRGVDVGIIGYLTPETKILAPRNKVEYEDEVIAIRREVDILKAEGVKIIIALGHSGFIKDLEIAQEVEDLDLVIGGHSNTFLRNSETSEKPETVQGPYPYMVKQASGRLVPVVQAYAYTKYLGKLHLTFDSNGEIIEYDGEPILLDHNIERDPEIVELVNKYREDIGVKSNEVVGKSLTYLNAEDCRLRECNIGNLINDAILNYTKEAFSAEYPHANIAVTQGGRIRASIDRPEKPFNLTRGDWITVLPFSDTLSIMTMNGTILKQALEHSVSTWRTVDSTGQFLQFSGIEAIYDLQESPGSRLVAAKAVCSICGDYKLADIQDQYEYQVITSTFIADGGDGYTLFQNLPKVTLEYKDLDSVFYYTEKYSPINPEISGRITVLNEDKVGTAVLLNLKSDKGAATTIHSKIYIYIAAISLIYTYFVA